MHGLRIKAALFVVLIITFETVDDSGVSWWVLDSQPNVSAFIPLSSLTKAQLTVKIISFEIQHLYTETWSFSSSR